MSIPDHSILPVDEADIPTLSAFVQSSKLRLAINRFLFINWPNEIAQSANYAKAVESSFKDSNVSLLKVVHAASGSIVAHLVLTNRTKPGSISERPPASNPHQKGTSDGLVPEVVSVVEEAIQEINEEFGDRNYIELTHIFVKSESRRKGIGAALVRLALEKAQAANLPLMTCSEPPAHEFFVKQGLKDTKHVDIDLRQWSPEYCGYGIFRISGMCS